MIKLFNNYSLVDKKANNIGFLLYKSLNNISLNLFKLFSKYNYMKIDLVFLVILGFMVLKTVCNNKTNINEHMAVNDETKTAINDAIKAIYAADVSAIQNLSDIANKLQTGGYTCPGDFSVTGKMNVGGALNVKNRDILAELDELKSKTQNITFVNANATSFKGTVQTDLLFQIQNSKNTCILKCDPNKSHLIVEYSQLGSPESSIEFDIGHPPSWGGLHLKNSIGRFSVDGSDLNIDGGNLNIWNITTRKITFIDAHRSELDLKSDDLPKLYCPAGTDLEICKTIRKNEYRI